MTEENSRILIDKFQKMSTREIEDFRDALSAKRTKLTNLKGTYLDLFPKGPGDQSDREELLRLLATQRHYNSLIEAANNAEEELSKKFYQCMVELDYRAL